MQGTPSGGKDCEWKSADAWADGLFQDRHATGDEVVVGGENFHRSIFDVAGENSTPFWQIGSNVAGVGIDSL